MRRSTFFTFTLFILSFTLKASEVHMKADAFNSSNKVVFVETQQTKQNADGAWDEIQVRYTTPEGKLIAELKADFAKDPFVPDSQMTDHRFNEKLEVYFDKTKNTVDVKITDLKSREIKIKSFTHSNEMVSTYGLHNYTVKHFDVKEATIKLLIPGMQEVYSFQFEQEKSNIKGQRRYSFSVSNWVLRAILNKIIMDYQEKGKVLTNYKGVSDIESDKHELQNLNLKMSYHGALNDK